jgi:hypothetical protein
MGLSRGQRTCPIAFEALVHFSLNRARGEAPGAAEFDGDVGGEGGAEDGGEPAEGGFEGVTRAPVRVVSVPSFRRFDEQPRSYKD